MRIWREATVGQLDIISKTFSGKYWEQLLTFSDKFFFPSLKHDPRTLWLHSLTSPLPANRKISIQPIEVACPLLSIYLSGFITAVAFFRKPNTISLFPHWSGFKFLVAKAACTLSIVFLERPLFLSGGVHSIINFAILSSDILLKWPYHCSLFFSMMSCFPFTSS